MIRRYIKNKLGFTLVELLIVLFILASVGTVAAGVVVGTLRGGTKGDNLNEVRQNGNYVISQITKMIAYSQEFQGVCNNPTGAPSYCTDPSNLPDSYSTVCDSSPTEYKYVRIKSFDGGFTVFSCQGTTIASNGADLIDTVKTKTTSCGFYCTRVNDSLSPRLNFKFTLISNTTSSFAEQNSSATFETTIQPRN